VSFKLPSTIQLTNDFPSLDLSEYDTELLPPPDSSSTLQEISLKRLGDWCGILRFDFYNGAMSTKQCERLYKAIRACSGLPGLQVLILAGSESNWSNGIHLNVIENAVNSNEEAWANIKAINNVVKETLKLHKIITIAAVQANAGAGGVYMALAADFVFAKSEVVLNPLKIPVMKRYNCGTVETNTNVFFQYNKFFLRMFFRKILVD
jgi:putative two-component system hydrogenase maturation factor HypX/HoxX